MTKQDKLTKLITLAVENGIELTDHLSGYGNCHWNTKGEMTEVDLNILFNHDFAKAIWGEESTCTCCASTSGMCTCEWNVLPCYQYHLTQAVISDDLLTYFWENK